jgi:hypothetical protein
LCRRLSGCSAFFSLAYSLNALFRRWRFLTGGYLLRERLARRYKTVFERDGWIVLSRSAVARNPE